MTSRKRFGANELIPCPSPSSLRRHLALAEYCATCGTEGRRVPLPSLAAVVACRRQLRARSAA